MGDTIEWDVQLGHDLSEIPSQAPFDTCDFTGSTLISIGPAITQTTFASPGVHYFACSVGLGFHCESFNMNVTVVVSGFPPCCDGDLNANGIVDVSDVSVVSACQGECRPFSLGCEAADLNFDGCVDGDDDAIIQCQLGGPPNLACCPDKDCDGVANGADNCDEVPNGPNLGSQGLSAVAPFEPVGCTAQEDGDCDGYGNACDSDFNNNGFADSPDILAVFACARSSPACTDLVFDLNCNGFADTPDVLQTYAGGIASPPVTPGPSGCLAGLSCTCNP